MSSSKSESNTVMDTDSSSMKCSRAAGHSGGIEKSNENEISNKDKQSGSELSHHTSGSTNFSGNSGGSQSTGNSTSNNQRQ